MALPKLGYPDSSLVVGGGVEKVSKWRTSASSEEKGWRLLTLSDFHDFGLTLKCQKIFPCGCTITSKTKINVV